MGAFLGFLAIVALGYTISPASNDGGIEMGAALVGAPVGLVVGAVLGGLLVLRLRRGRETSSRQAWMAFGIIGAVLAGLYIWLFYEPPEPVLKGAPVRLISEFRVPWSEVGEEEYKNYSPNVQTWNMRVLSPVRYDPPERVGDEVIWRAAHELLFDYEDRLLFLQVGYKRLLALELPLPGNPAHQEDFTDWMPPTHVREHAYGENLPGPYAARIRYRIDRATN